MTTTSIIANALQPGMRFKLRPSKRKWLQVQNVFNNLPAPDEGKTLVVLADCRQLVLEPQMELILHDQEP